MVDLVEMKAYKYKDYLDKELEVIEIPEDMKEKSRTLPQPPHRGIC